jgi:multiple sugar transport system substrate-binding protein
MISRRFRIITLLVVIALALSSAALGSRRAQAQDGTFFGKTAAELFPDAVSDLERDNAMKALLAAGMPDGKALGEGKTLTVATLGQGARGGISGTLYFWRNAFEAATGAKLEIIEVPFGQLQTTIPTDFLTQQNTYDVIVNAAWFYGDYIGNGWIQPITKYVGDARFPSWKPEAVAAPLKNLMTWGGEWYGTTNDGDAQLFYYRRDVLADPKWQAEYKAATGKDLPNPPTSWQQLLEVTTFFNGKDWNGDGDPDDGISLHLKVGGQGMFHFMTLSAPFAITPADGDDPTKVTKYDNVYWFDPEDFSAVINEPGQVMALEFLKSLSATGQQAQFGWELGEAWDNFLGGNAIATFSWGDVGSLSQDTNRSKIKGKLGASRILCSEMWYDREAKAPVTNAEKPNCVGNTTGGSWHPMLSSFSDSPELGYYFMAMLANPSLNFYNATTGWQGIDPSSTYQLFPPRGEAKVEDYTAYGFDAGDVESYINGYGENMFSFPTSQTYLRIPGTPAYWTALDIRLSEVMTGQKTPKEGLDAVVEDWKAITDSVGGAEKQLPLYQAAIGYSK